MRITDLVVVVLAATIAAPAVQAGPLQHNHGGLNERGATVMGFDQEKTVHHFHLYADGGAIDVTVKDRTDAKNLEAIRSHLPQIARLFSEGNYNQPMLVHGTTVPGTVEMTRLKERVTFEYVTTPGGGRVEITTTDPEALAAVHAFLRFQISDHATGDSTEVRKRHDAR